MEKNMNMYPDVPHLPGAPDAPPTYNQTFNPASAPTAEYVPMISPAPVPMQPQPQPQPQMVYFHQQNATIPPLGPRPCNLICPSCHQQQLSTVRYETSTKTHLFAAVICLLGLFCCACIPYCVDSCKNPNHYCSNCDAYLGVYNK